MNKTNYFVDVKQKPGAKNVIDQLSLISDKLGPHKVAYWVMPNMVLTLSGARAIGDMVFYYSKKSQAEVWKTDLHESLNILVRNKFELLKYSIEFDINPSKEDYLSLNLLAKEGLNYAINQTKLLTDPQKQILLDAASSKPKNLLKNLVIGLKKNIRLKDYSNDNLYHTAYGILLGYPDAAILGYLESNFIVKPDNFFAEPNIAADIRGANFISCPQPVYDYPRSLINDQSIVNHEKLWSNILYDFYHSDFYIMLAKDKKFAKLLKELQQ